MPFGRRADADRCKNVPATRAIMPFLMRGRNEAIVFFEQKVDVTDTFALIEKMREQTGLRLTFLHLMVLAGAKTLGERPRLNRFVAGKKLWQRRGIWFSLSAKREKSDDGPIAVIKRRLEPDASLGDVFAAVDTGVKQERSGKSSYVDKELGLVLAFPTFVVSFFMAALRWLDHGGWLPRSFIDNDPMYASMFIANLGSIGLDSAFHHLYEYGTISLFCTAGKAEHVTVPGEFDDDGNPKLRLIMPLRYSYDERVEDGFYAAQALALIKQYLEAPEAHLNLDTTSASQAAEPSAKT